MRSRNIKPGFFKNEGLAELEPLARILFEGLWCMADREGRLKDRPKRIKAEVLPYDDCDVDRLLQELADHEERFIVRYSINHQSIIGIPSFLDHQAPHYKEKPSELPAYPHNSNDRSIIGQSSPDDNVTVGGGSFLIPDSGFLKDGAGEVVDNSGDPVDNSRPAPATSSEKEILNRLMSIGWYPFDATRDLELIREDRDPRVNVLREISKFRDYYADEPKKGRRYRLRWRNWLEKAEQIVKDKSGPLPPAQSEWSPPAGPDPDAEEVPMPAELRESIAGIGRGL